MWETFDEQATSPEIPFRTWTEPLPDGEAGTVHTLQRMAQLVQRDSKTATVKAWVDELRGGRSLPDFVDGCFKLARDFIKFKNDPYPYELIQDFERLAQSQAGDCDDKVMFLATLLRCAGLPVRFVVQSYTGEQWDHVFLETNYDGRWISLDPAADGHKGFVAPMGWRQSLPDQRGREAVFYV